VEAREAIMVRHIRLGALSLAALFVLSSCGGGSSSSGASSGGAASGGGSSGGSSSAGVKAAGATKATAALQVHHTSLGNVLVNGQGMTVYMLTADKPGHSSCSTQCLGYWSPVPPVAKPGTLHGISAKVASTASMAGKPMATAGGWPLYTYVGDHGPGDTTGEGIRTFGGVWYAVSPSGQPVKAGSSAGSSSSGSSGGGYGY
jgi:predicted lipoprotein with Yx(FWY)xxD motif